MTPFQTEDSHDLCPSCLGLEHLVRSFRASLNELQPHALSIRDARLAEVEQLIAVDIPSPMNLFPPAEPKRPQRGLSQAAAAAPVGKKANF